MMPYYLCVGHGAWQATERAMRIAYRTHQIEDAEHVTYQEELRADDVARIAESMEADGWQGVAVVTYKGILLTGNHRATAADDAGIEIVAVDLIDLIRSCGVDEAEIDDEIETYAKMGCDDYQIAEELCGLMSQDDRDNAGIDFGAWN